MDENNKSVETKPLRDRGLSAKAVIIPVATIMLFLHAFIVTNMLRIGTYSTQISEIMQGNFAYLQVSKEFESGAETLSDKVRIFVNTGNLEYLENYLDTVRNMEDQGRSMRGLVQSSQGGGADELITELLSDFDERVAIECHAMRLVAESRGIDIGGYEKLSLIALTEEEQAYSAAEKQAAAERMLADGGYLRINPATHEYVGRAIRAVSEETGRRVGQQSAMLGRSRMLQWVATAAIIVLLSVMMNLLFVMLIRPLERSVESVSQGEALPTDHGVSEFRRLANSYNELLHHKRMTESYLRKQSQTDALTKLPNRLAFQEYVSQLSWERAHSAITVFSLDVNGLKETNDRHGHSYGDDLLRRCASCILSVFGDSPDRQCFRFGGDEFAAFWVNVPQEEIMPALERFQSEQVAHDVSVSIGYASTDDLSHTSVEELFEQADKCMYEEKARHHRVFNIK